MARSNTNTQGLNPEEDELPAGAWKLDIPAAVQPCGSVTPGYEGVTLTSKLSPDINVNGGEKPVWSVDAVVVVFTKVVFVDLSVTVQVKLVAATFAHPAGQVVVVEKLAVEPVMAALRLTVGQQVGGGGGGVPATWNVASPKAGHPLAVVFEGKVTVHTTTYVPPLGNGRAPTCTPFDCQLAPGSSE